MPFTIDGIDFEQTAGGPQRVKRPTRPSRSEALSIEGRPSRPERPSHVQMDLGDGSDNPLVNALGGVALGLVEDPIIGFGIRKLFGEDVRDDLIADISATIGDSTTGAVGRFVGEWGTLLAGGMGAYSKGASVAVNTAAKLNAKGMIKGGDNILFRQSFKPITEADHARRLSEGALGMTERVAQGVGGTAGYAAFEGARAYGETEDLGDAAKAAAVGAAFGGALEGALVYSKFGKYGLSAAKAKYTTSKLEELGPVAKKLRKAHGKAREKVDEAIAEYDTLLKVKIQETSLVQSAIKYAEEARQPLGGLGRRVEQQAELLTEIKAAKKVAATARRDAKMSAKVNGGKPTATAAEELTRAEEALQLLNSQKAAMGIGQESPKNLLRKARGASKKADKAARDAYRKERRFREGKLRKKEKLEGTMHQADDTARLFEEALEKPWEFMMHDRVFDPRAFPTWARKFGSMIFTTPEGKARSLGAIANRMGFVPLSEADMATQLAGIKHAHLISHFDKRSGSKGWFERTIDNLNVTKKMADKDRNLFAPLFDAWEKGSKNGVRAYMEAKGATPTQIDDQLQAFAEMKTIMADMAETLHGMGARKLMDPKELARRGVMEYLPLQIVKGLDDETLRKGLTGTLGRRGVDDFMIASRAPGLSKSAHFDYNRVKTGSILDKLNDKDLKTVYETNPFKALESYLNGGQYRIEYGSKFGLDGEATKGIIQAIREESGDQKAEIMQGVFNQAFGRSHIDLYNQQLSRIALGTQVMTKLGLAVIPNMSQWINAPIMMNLKQTYAAVKALKATPEMVDHALGITQSAFDYGKEGLKSGATQAALGRVGQIAEMAEKGAGKVLKYTGFSWIERMNRRISGATGLFVYKDLIGKLATGKLIGKNYDMAVRQLDSLGVHPNDLKELLKGYRVGGEAVFTSELGREMEHHAIYRAAQLTQFTPGALRRPSFWDHPAGKVAFQFKTFALNHGRFMKDQVWAEAANGNMLPLAKVLSVYPVAGEFIGNMKSVAKMKPRDKQGMDRLIGNYMALGGVGLLGDVIKSAQWGGLSSTALGPTAGDVLDLGESIMQGDVGAWLENQANNPTMQAARLLASGVGYGIDAAVDAANSDDSQMDQFRQPRTKQ